MAFGVGLGNVWRFPYLVQKYGGGSFIIPFLVMMFVEAMPLLLVELGLGQKFRSGSVGIWNKLHPYFQGIFNTIYRVFNEMYYISYHLTLIRSFLGPSPNAIFGKIRSTETYTNDATIRS